MRSTQLLTSALVVVLTSLSFALAEAAPQIVKVAPPEVVETAGQTGALISPNAPDFPNWPYSPKVDLPSYLDWRDNNGNYVSGVRDQDPCNACWAFAPVALLESMAMIHDVTPGADLDFSEQYILSCLGGNNDCNWGYADQACDFMMTSGTPDNYCFEYEGDDNVPCSDVCDDHEDLLHRLDMWYFVTTNVYDTEPIKQALQYGPVMTWFQINEDFSSIDGWEIYSGHGSPYTDTNHYALIIGYDDVNQCWLVKNSYGTDWAQDGFFRVAYDNGCWFGLYSIAGAYGAPATNIDLRWTLEEAQETYSDYELEVRVYDDNENLLTDIPFDVNISSGSIVEIDPNTGGYGIGRATIRATSSGPLWVSVNAIGQTEGLRTTTHIGPLDPLVPFASIPETPALIPAAIAWSPDGSTLALASHDGGDGEIRFIDADTRQTIRTETFENRTCGVGYSPDGTKLVIAFSNEIGIFDLALDQIVDSTEVVDGNPGDSRSTYWPTENRIITPDITSGDDYMSVLDGSLNLLQNFTTTSFSSGGVSVAGNIIWVCSGTGPDQVYCYTLSSLSHSHTFDLLDPLSAAVDPGGTRIAIAQDNDDIRVFGISDWQLKSTITGDFTDEMAFMEWSSDGNTIAGIDQDDYFWAIEYLPSTDEGFPLGKSLVSGSGMDGMVAWHPDGLAVACMVPSSGVQLFSPRDAIDPSVSITSPPNGFVTSDLEVQVSGVASDLSGIRRVIASNGDWTESDEDLTDGYQFVVPLTSGLNVISIDAFDAALRSTREQVQVTSGLSSAGEAGPAAFRVNDCFPNPANPGTWVSFELPSSLMVDIAVYDLAGRQIRRLVDRQVLPQGTYRRFWNGMDGNGHPIGSGTYVFVVKAGDEIETRNVVILK